MKSFVYAWRGLVYTVRTQRNMRIHICFAVYVVLAGFVTRISEEQWLAVLICIAAVFGAECLNTALESLCNTVHPQRAQGIAHAKDAAAGAVLVLAIVAAVVGGIVFFNGAKIGAAIDFFRAQPVTAGLIAASLIPAVIFVFHKPRNGG